MPQPQPQQQLVGKANMPAYSLDLHHRAFPELAAALRATIEPILHNLRRLSLQEMPHLDHYTIQQFENDLRIILESVAVALASDDPEQIRSLIESAPRHGFSRFLIEGNLLDLFTEERILRGVMVVAIEDELHRPLKADEAAALHATIDIMIQQGVLAMVQNQKEKLREAAEAELKFLSFFSHDLSNNMFVISASLQALSLHLKNAEQFKDARHVLDTALRTMKHTNEGMRRLLHHERLRRSNQKLANVPVNLHEKFDKIATFYSDEARAKGMRIVFDVDPDWTIETDPDLLFIILQNIVGNAIKHSTGSETRLEAKTEKVESQERCRISIADQGPGIAPDQLNRIFLAFERGQMTDRGGALGIEGVGLGLAIASQAAKLLNARIDVDSKLGHGTTFHIHLPTSIASTQPANNQPTHATTQARP